MNEQDEKQLWLEIEHIFDSGANKLRVFNMVKSFIEKRYQSLHLTTVVEQSKQFYCNNRDWDVNTSCKKQYDMCRYLETGELQK